MKKGVMSAALAGLAFGASGQTVSTDLVVHLSMDSAAFCVGDTGTATITASWNGVVGSYLSSFTVDLIASAPLIEVLSVAPIAWNNPSLGFTGAPSSIEGANIIGFQASQFSLIPPFDSANPILVSTFTYRVIAGGLFSYSTENAAGAPFAFSVTGPVFNDPVVQFGNEAFHSDEVFFCPSPSSLGLLAMSGMVAGRRRR